MTLAGEPKNQRSSVTKDFQSFAGLIADLKSANNPVGSQIRQDGLIFEAEQQLYQGTTHYASGKEFDNIFLC